MRVLPSFLVHLALSGLCFEGAASAKQQPTFVLPATSTHITLDSIARFYCDKQGKALPKEILSASFVDSFSTAVRGTPNFGFSRSIYWARVVLRDTSGCANKWVLETGVPGIHKADCYCAVDTGMVVAKSGFLRRGSLRALPYLYPSFSIPAFPHSQQVVYLRFESQTPLLLPFTLYHESGYAAHDRAVQTILALYFGALFIMALYHLLVFAFLRDKSFLYYTIFIALFAVGQMTSVYGFLIGQNSWRFVIKSFPLLHCVNFAAGAIGLLFTRALLSTRRFIPQIDHGLVVLTVAMGTLAVLSPFLGFMTSERVLVIGNLLVSVVMLASAISVLRKKYSPGLYFLIGMGIFVAGIISYNLMYGFNVLPFSFVGYFIPNICFIVTILLFSIGIAQRILIIQQERDSAYAEAVQNLQQILEYKEEKARLEEELSHARTMEAIGHLVSGICHDLKNLLTPLFGYADLIRVKAANNPQIRQHADGLYAAADKTRELVMKLLDFSRKKPRKTELVNMETIVNDVALLLRHGTRSGVTITTESRVSVGLVSGDPTSFQNALLNLGLNAMDAMSSGGTVAFTLGSVTLASGNDLLRKFDASPGKYVELVVSDTGTGIPAEIMDRIFEPFFTTKGAGKGTGLGLASVYGCVKSHNGCVRVASEMGKGSTFTLYFKTAQSGITAEQQNEERSGKDNGTVLLINQENAIKDMIIEVLDDAGYTVIPVQGINDGIEHYRNNVYTINLVVLDASANHGEMLHAFDAMKEINPCVRVVLVTDASDRHANDELLAQGVCAIVKKPFELDGFLNAVAVANARSPLESGSRHA